MHMAFASVVAHTIWCHLSGSAQSAFLYKGGTTLAEFGTHRSCLLRRPKEELLCVS